MTPELFFQAINASDARAPSAARLAAEAFFSPAPVVADEQAQTAVSVVRPKLKVELESAEQASVAESNAALPRTPRAPRVFRLDATTAASKSSLVVTGEEEAEIPSEKAAIAVEEFAGEPATPTSRLPRKKARRRHGEVTIIRPTGATSEQAPAPANEPNSEPGPVAAFIEGDEWPRYPALLKQLRLLQAQAEEVRRAEAAEALLWIKTAIREHGITVRELGL